MGKYKMHDFNVGEQVYHLSNTKLRMVAIELHPTLNEVSCRWVDGEGQVQCVEFMPEELGKTKDFGPRIRAI